jgi:hypothetical protein
MENNNASEFNINEDNKLEEAMSKYLVELKNKMTSPVTNSSATKYPIINLVDKNLEEVMSDYLADLKNGNLSTKSSPSYTSYPVINLVDKKTIKDDNIIKIEMIIDENTTISGEISKKEVEKSALLHELMFLQENQRRLISKSSSQEEILNNINTIREKSLLENSTNNDNKPKNN